MRERGEAQAIRDNPSWAKQPKEWFLLACWAFGYTEQVPDRAAVAKALGGSPPRR
jgi:hypothetical protein